MGCAAPSSVPFASCVRLSAPPLPTEEPSVSVRGQFRHSPPRYKKAEKNNDQKEDGPAL